MTTRTTQSATLATLPSGVGFAFVTISSEDYQPVVIADGTNGTARLLALDASGRPTVNVNGTVTVGDGGSTISIDDGGGSITVDGTFTSSTSIVRTSAAPTITAGAYATKDAVGGVLTFANAAASSGGAGRIECIQISDKDSVNAALILFLFDRSIAASGDNNPFDPTDTEITQCVGYVAFGPGDYQAFADNSVAHVDNIGIDYKINSGTDLFGQLMVIGTPTYASTTALTVTLTLAQY